MTFTSAGEMPGDWYGIRFRDTGPASLLDIEGGAIGHCRIGVDVVYHDIRLVGVTVAWKNRMDLSLAISLGRGG